MATRLDWEGTTFAVVASALVRTAIGVGVTWLAYDFAGPTGLIFATLVWALLLPKMILDWLPALPRSARAAAVASREGDVYTFETHELRVLSIGGYPWVVDSDLLAVLGEEPTETLRRRYDAAHGAKIPGMKLWAYSEAGAIKVLSASRHPDAHKLRLFLERQVFLPARKRREREQELGL
ncbi:MAG TPA: hypothetical protein VEV20_15195 [Burkholderiales bacterium]|nr:hypothetical protein [Burkholderiales bacterium]